MAFIYGMVGETMEKWVLLKANIKHKKGAFISILTLMCLVAMAVTTILSLRYNCEKTVETELTYADAPDIVTFMKYTSYSDALLEKVEDHQLVESVKVYDAVVSDGAKINGMEDGNGWYLQKMHYKHHLFNQDLSEYEKETPALESGEIYLPQGIKTKMSCQAGDVVELETFWGTYEFTIKGFIVEPCNGASVMGWKQVYISDKDFDMLFADAKKYEKREEEMTAHFHIINIYKSDRCDLNDGKFARKINLDTGIIDSSLGSLTREQTMHYTTLFSEVICSTLLVFVGILMVVVLIVMGNNITTSMEMEYANLGVLKAYGFTKEKIRFIYTLQYVLAQVIGSVIGFVLALPLVKVLGKFFQPIMAMLIQYKPAVGVSIAVIGILILLSVGFVYFSTRKVAGISPVRAIRGGRDAVYFDSRIQLPIQKRGISFSLALRQFTSNLKQYVGIVAIVSILTFFMMTVMGLGNALTSESASKSMGMLYTELSVKFIDGVTDEMSAQMEDAIEEITEIEAAYYMQTQYMALDGEKIYCSVYRDPELISGMLKGRQPLYDNEIVVTEILADALDLHLGDTVTVSLQEERGEYLITGFYQDLSDTGMCFSMSMAAAEKLGMKNIYHGMYEIKDSRGGHEIVSLLQERFGDKIEAKFYEDMEADETYKMAVNAMKAVIYGFSVIFALVAVAMVCSKAFLREKTDIGIYKAIGFTSDRLRMHFAIRFLIIAVVGSLFGSVMSILGSEKMLSQLLRMIGISNFVVDYTVAMFVIPIIVICACFFVFAYVVAGKVKRVSVRELVVE